MTDDYEDFQMMPEYLDTLREMAEVQHWDTAFQFLRAHNGWRNSKTHVIMGSAHSGKSTLVRSLVLDALERNPKKVVMVVLSEESKSEFLVELSNTGLRSESMLKRLKIYSEMDDRFEAGVPIEIYAKENKADIIFYDNLTTSQVYMDRRPAEQSAVAKRLKKIAKNLCIPMVNIVHTGAEITDNMTRLVEMNDVRGSKQVVMQAEFFYVIQTFHMNDHIYPTIRITKHRGQDCDAKLYYLHYNSKQRIFFNDKALSFKDFKRAWKDRNHL